MKITDECPFRRAERLAVDATANPSLIGEYNRATEIAKALEGAPGWKGSKGKMTQCEKILKHIRKVGYITMRAAWLEHNISSFWRRIADLREQGYDIITVPAKNPITGQEYSRYYLRETLPESHADTGV